jgi:arylsulfatase A-like enzyme/tetratricopeptide (TPR) repeat protein
MLRSRTPDRIQPSGCFPAPHRAKASAGRHSHLRLVIDRAALIAITAALLGACARAPAPAIRRDPAQNVLLVTIDTLRADALGAYGNQAATTPWIDRLATGGVRFTAAHASTVITLPSHATILSGLYPFHHGVRENAGFRFPAEADTLATLLKAKGYRTAAFVSAFPLDSRFGLTRGFDIYDDRFDKSDNHQAFHVPERPGTATVADAVKWIREGGAPWFAWVHLYEPHFPYAPPEPFASRYRAKPYDGEVAAADAALAPLLHEVLDGSGKPTFVVLTGDHGESLGEHGEMTHGLFAYEPTLHVPLILNQPRLFQPRVISQSVRHVDILPTILDALGAPLPQHVDGVSLLPAASGRGPEPQAAYFESLSASINRGWAPLYGVASGTLKYIDLPIPELYDLSTDPSEQQNLASSRTDDVQRLQRLLAGFRATDAGAVPRSESASTREQLRSLGYVTGTVAPKRAYTEQDDPKRLIAVDRALDEVVSKYQSGDLAGAIATAERISTERPNMPLSLVHLAFLYNEAGDHRRAVEAIGRALALNPQADDVAALAGAYFTEAGLAGRAVKLLEPFTRRTPPDVDVLIAYGVALATSGRGAAALRAFDRARQIDPQNGLPLANAGTVYLMAGDRGRAAAAFQAALDVDPHLARAENGLGVIAAEGHDPEAALDHWKRAVESDPRDFETLFNIGDLLIRLGREDEGKLYWERYLNAAPPSQERKDRKRVSEWLAAHK